MFIKLWQNLFGRAQAFIDPVSAAMQRSEIQAVAKYWRANLAFARIRQILDGSDDTTVKRPFTHAELNALEHSLVNQLARTLVYVPNARLFQECGQDISFYITSAAWDAGLRDNLVYPGFFTRMRILLDKEVAHELPPYQSRHWVCIWQAQPLKDSQ